MNSHTALQYLPPFLDGLSGWGLLLLRLVFGSAMIAAGLPKIKAPLHWMDAILFLFLGPGIFSIDSLLVQLL